MIVNLFAAITSQEIYYFGVFLCSIILALFTSMVMNWWFTANSVSNSPYTGRPMRRGSDLHYMTVEKMLRYLFDRHDYYNRMFDWRHAAFCRDTGRIFPDCKRWYGAYKVDWSFLQKRHPGQYVSWGSLTEEQRLIIRDRHDTLEGFQTEFSSSIAKPEKVEKEYAFMKPGPLYVDLETGILLGWKCVPDTELELLIVQKPVEKYLPGIHKKY